MLVFRPPGIFHTPENPLHTPPFAVQLLPLRADVSGDWPVYPDVVERVFLNDCISVTGPVQLIGAVPVVLRRYREGDGKVVSRTGNHVAFIPELSFHTSLHSPRCQPPGVMV